MSLKKNQQEDTERFRISRGTILIIMVILTLVLFLSVSYLKNQSVLSSTRILYKEIAEDYYPCVIQDCGGNIHVAWQSDRNGNWDIYYTCSVVGLNRNEFINLTRSSEDDMFPSLVEDKIGNIWVVWIRFGLDGTSIRRKIVDSQEIMPNKDEELISSADNCEKRSPSMICVDSNRMLLAWISRKGKDQEIRYAVIHGDSIKESNLLCRTSNAQKVGLGKTADEIFVLWDSANKDRNNLFLSIFDKDGEFFHEYTLLGSDTGEDFVGNNPSILVRNGRPSILFFCNENADILLSVETSNYNEIFPTYPKFSTSVLLCETGAVENCPVAVEDEEGEIFLFWVSDYTGDNEIFFCHSSDVNDFIEGGIQYEKGPRNMDEEAKQFVKNLTMDPNKNNSNPEGYFLQDIFLSTAVIGDELWVIWDSYQWDITQENNRRRIKYVKTEDGDLWSHPITILDTNNTKRKGRDDRHPAIVGTDNGYIWLFWHSDRYRGDDEENYEICYIESRDGGNSWIWNKEDEDPFLLTENSAKDICPSASSIGNRIFVVWQSNRRLGDFDIYLREFDGKKWLEEKCIANDDVPELHPSIALLEGRDFLILEQEEDLIVAWEYAKDIDFIIYYKTPGLEEKLSEISAPQNMSVNFPNVAYVSGEPWLVWQYGEITGDQTNISCRSVSSKEISITDDFSFNTRPTMAQFNGKIWFFWDSSGNGNGRGIYYKLLYPKGISSWVFVPSVSLFIGWIFFFLSLLRRSRGKSGYGEFALNWNPSPQSKKYIVWIYYAITLMGSIISLITFFSI